MRYDAAEMACFDIHMLERTNAGADQTLEACAIAERPSDSMGDDGRAQLLTSIMSGLPGAYARCDAAGLRQVLAPWESPTPDDLRRGFMPLLQEVMPTVKALGAESVHKSGRPNTPAAGRSGGQ